MKQTQKNLTPWIYFAAGVCVISYIFTDATKILIPGLTPFSLAVALILYAVQHYRDNRDRNDGLLKPQMIILCIFSAIPVLWGILQIVAYIIELAGVTAS